MFWFIPLIGLASAAAIGIIAITIYHIISHRDIRREVNEIPVDNAFKYKILEAKKHSVHVGIFDKKDNLLQEVELRSDEGVSQNVQRSVSKEYVI